MLQLLKISKEKLDQKKQCKIQLQKHVYSMKDCCRYLLQLQNKFMLRFIIRAY